MGRHNMTSSPILVTGATGYVGGRVALRLIEEEYRVRVTGRSLKKLQARAWANNLKVELIPSNALDLDSMILVAKGCEVAYYLVHSINSSTSDFVKTDREAAKVMVETAKRTGLKRIIYLGGLCEKHCNLSEHLQSRIEVADILMSGSVPVTYFRAATILGSGSTSFEMLRYLVDRLPIMITSKRILTPSQPIAIRNVLVYLVECIRHEETIGKTYDIGGPEVITYRNLIDIYAEEAGLRKRHVFTTPLITPKIASLMIHFITPIPSYIGAPLTKGLGAEMIVRDGHKIRNVIPQKLLTPREAIKMALERIEQKIIKSSWMDAGAYKPPEWGRYNDAPFAGGTIKESWYKMTMRGTPGQVWRPISCIGGNTGWYFANWLWGLRGFIDRLAGGYGTRRGRRHPTEIKTGDALDWWRVIDADPGKRLLLLAEMRAPGEATLEFRIKECSDGVTELVQIASFLPRGVAGLLYWYAVYPLHYFIFRGMLKNIARAADAEIVAGPDEIKPPPHRRG